MHHCRKRNLIRIRQISKSPNGIVNVATLGVHTQQSITHINILLNTDLHSKPMTPPSNLYIQQSTTGSEHTGQSETGRQKTVQYHRTIDLHGLLVETVSDQGANHVVPREGVPLGHCVEQLARGPQLSGLAVGTQNRVPRVNVLTGRAVERRASAPRLAARGVQLDEAVAEEGGVEEAEAEDAGMEELAGPVGSTVDAGPQEAREAAAVGALKLHYSEAADFPMLYSWDPGKISLDDDDA